KDVVVVAPDHSGVKLARNLAECLKAPIAIVDKRDSKHIDKNTDVIGGVKAHQCIIFEDMIDTRAKMADAAVLLKQARATYVYGCATHAIFSGNAVNELKNSALKEVIVTDTIQMPEEKKFE